MNNIVQKGFLILISINLISGCKESSDNSKNGRTIQLSEKVDSLFRDTTRIDRRSDSLKKAFYNVTQDTLNQKTNKITYSAANNAPILIREGEITELEKDRMPVGKGERTDPFTTHQIELQKNDSLYLYTDGYADQFGGPKGKKFLYKRLNELLKSLNPDELAHRGDKLNYKFEEWKGTLEQVDDVLVIGIKI